MRLLIARSSGALLALALLAGCGGVDSVVARAHPTATATPAGQSADERTIAIYSAVIRQAVTGGRTLRPAKKTRFTHIAVLDRAVQTTGGFADESRPSGPAFDAAVREGISVRLADLAPVEFVGSSDDARSPSPQRRPAREGGVIVTLGEIEGSGLRVEVANRFWCGGLCGEGTTYVLGPHGWRGRVGGRGTSRLPSTEAAGGARTGAGSGSSVAPLLLGRRSAPRPTRGCGRCWVGVRSSCGRRGRSARCPSTRVPPRRR